MAVLKRSASPSSPPAKRAKTEEGPQKLANLDTEGAVANSEPETRHVGVPLAGIASSSRTLTAADYRDGVHLAPMVRSGTLPSRLIALKYGANLVWGPEIVDKAIIGAERIVDPETGVISYQKKANSYIWSTHPVEKPFLIYQIGSSSPSHAVQAALTVVNDVSGIDLNCGCPKPFSTSGGMGAALLTNPDLLCSILTSLRAALPPSMPLTAKIRLLPDQKDTLELVRRIVETGVTALTVHCRTRDMRPGESALVHRLKEIVEFVEGMGRGVVVLENGDCVGRDDAQRIRSTTDAHGVLVATAAEKNTSCFTSGPLADAETVVNPTYFSLAKYLKNQWGNTKHCLSQFASPHPVKGQAGRKEFRQKLAQAKDYSHFEGWYSDEVMQGGKAVLEEVEAVVQRRLRADSTIEMAVVSKEHLRLPAVSGAKEVESLRPLLETLRPEVLPLPILV